MDYELWIMDGWERVVNQNTAEVSWVKNKGDEYFNNR